MCSTAALEPLLVTIPQAAKILGIGRTSLYALMASGELPVIRYGRIVRISRRAIDAHIERQVTGQTQAA